MCGGRKMTAWRCRGRKPPVSGYVIHPENFVRENSTFHGQKTIFEQLVRKSAWFHGGEQPESENVRGIGAFYGESATFGQLVRENVGFHGQNRRFTGRDMPRRSERHQVSEDYRGHGLYHRRSTERKADIVPARDFQLRHLPRSEIERHLRPADA